MFQPSLTRDGFNTDSAMGVTIFMDDRSMCTFSTDEEVSEFVCIHYTLHEYPRISKDEMLVLRVYIILLYSALCALHADCVFVCMGYA